MRILGLLPAPRGIVSTRFYNPADYVTYSNPEVDNMGDNIKELKDLEREMSAVDTKIDEEVEENCGPGMGWVPGLVLIGIGALFLINNFTDFHLNNWWALFILIPAFGSLGNFMRAYRKDGRINSEARGSLIGSLILFFVASIFLFGWNWGAVWPVFLIIAGIGALLSGLLD